jgi:hypothetical protein
MLEVNPGHHAGCKVGEETVSGGRTIHSALLSMDSLSAGAITGAALWMLIDVARAIAGRRSIRKR